MKLFTNLHNIVLNPKDDCNGNRLGLTHLIVDNGNFVAVNGQSMVIAPIEDFPITDPEYLEGKAIHHDVVKRMAMTCWEEIQCDAKGLHLFHKNEEKNEFHQYSGTRFEGTFDDMKKLEGGLELFEIKPVANGITPKSPEENFKSYRGIVYVDKDGKPFKYPNYHCVIPEYKTKQPYNYFVVDPYRLSQVLECFASSLNKDNESKIEIDFADDPNGNKQSPNRAMRVKSFNCSGVGYVMPSLGS